ncbi:MAG: 2-dehydropantoate 2-reductase [Acetobacteraceae bacterium]
MRLLILGAGALGGYFGAKLTQGGAEVEYLVRPGRAAQLRADGLVIIANGAESRTPAKGIGREQIAGAYDVVLLGCKGFDLEDAIESVAPAIGPATTILPVLNGIRHIDILAARFGRDHVLGCQTFENASLRPDGVIVRPALTAFRGYTTFGELGGGGSARCEAIREALAAGGMEGIVSDDILAAMWAKFRMFCFASTITTLCRSRAGAIAASASSGRLVEAVLAEVGAVTAAEGYPVSAEQAVFLRSLFADPESIYGPSMLWDMQNNRRTEAEHVIGDMVDRAARLGVAVPVMTAARCNLEAYEINRQRAQS